MKELREARAIAPRDIAKYLNISLADLTRFERGEERIAPNLLGQLAELCGVRIDWFFLSAPADGRPISKNDDEMVARFMKLPETPQLIRAFNAIPSAEGRLVVVTFARMASAPTI